MEILSQPDDTTCGPTCLHAVYLAYGDSIGLGEVVADVSTLEGGGTLAVFLACHALQRGYGATLYTYDLQMFDPTWFEVAGTDLRGKLIEQAQLKNDPKLHMATDGFLKFLELGGTIRYEDLTPALIRHYLTKGRPILTGLSATYLYRAARETVLDNRADDIRGLPSGHFVVLYSYDRKTRRVLIADPLLSNPFADGHNYSISIERVLGAILLGLVTYDANLLILDPPGGKPAKEAQ